MRRHGMWWTLPVLAAIAATLGVMVNEHNDRRIDYIEFQAQDLERIKKFYSEVFRWKFTDYGPDYTSFEDGRLAGGFGKGESSVGGPLAVIYAVELEVVESEILRAGGEIVKPIFQFPGGRRFHFRDPGGNELAVWSDK